MVMKKIKHGKAMESDENSKRGREAHPDNMTCHQGSGQNGVGEVEQDTRLLRKNAPGKGNRRYKVHEIGMLKGY